jgi:hypothetical protein
VLAGDRDRESAAEALREQYVRGRLSVEELTRRTDVALAAHTRADLRDALAGLPVFFEGGKALAQRAMRGAMLVVFTGAYILFSLTLLFVLALVLVIHGASATELAAFLVVWLVPTYLLSRLWRGSPADRRHRT